MEKRRKTDHEKLSNELNELCSRGEYLEALNRLKSIKATKESKNLSFALIECTVLYFNAFYAEADKLLSQIEKIYDPSKLHKNKEYILLKFRLLKSRSQISKAIRFLSRTLKTLKDNDIEHFVRYLLGEAYFWSGNYLQSNYLLQRCYTYYLRSNNNHMLGVVLHELGYIAYQRRFYDIAENYFEKALESFEKVGRKYQIAATNMMLGILNYKIGRYDEALDRFEIAKENFIACGNRKGLLQVTIDRARVKIYREKYKEAVSLLEESYKLASELGLPREESLSLEFLGEISCLTGEYEKALEYLKRAEEIALKMAPEGDVAVEVFRRLGETYLGMERFEEAEEYLSKAYRVAEKLEDRSEFGAVLRLYGVLSAKKKDIDLSRAFFNESIVTLKVIKDRYELGRTCIEAAKTYRELLSGSGLSGTIERELLSDAKDYAVEALHIFSELGIERKVEECRRLVEEIEADRPAVGEGRRTVRVMFKDEWLHEGLIVGRSAAMLEVLELVRRFAPSDVSVLVTGETGTGKELVARLIHRLSGRSKGPFVAVNCASIPESMFESELFGHRRGAFTGADRDHVGLVEKADGGTLFLDEISELTSRQQASLLRVLQERRVKRVGETSERPVDIRLITASNESVESLFESGKLRPDFYYRISGNVIGLPPLRERREDVEAIFSYYLNMLLPGARVEEGLLDYLHEYHWPGNVRELVNLVQVLAVLAESSGVVRVSNLPMNIRGGDPELSAMGSFRFSRNKRDDLQRAITDALRECGGNKSAAARRLGISRSTLYKRMQELGIE